MYIERQICKYDDINDNNYVNMITLMTTNFSMYVFMFKN